jgi:Zn-dependent metalloprotease
MCKNHRNPIQCILPPYITDKMKDSDRFKVEDALDNELRNYRFRSDRKFFSSMSTRALEMFAIKKITTVKPKAVIEIYDVAHGTSLPGKKMTKDAIENDNDAKNVKNSTQYTWEFYYNILNRNSIDDGGMVLVNSIHYGNKYENAMWNGRQMIYGDGDGKVFDSFTVDIDIIGHELTHGITQYSANLDYENQPGALNESFSDVFGILIKQYALNQDVNQSNWLIGENVMLGNTFALRSMIAPGTAFKDHPIWGNDPQPATMDGFLTLPNTKDGDWGGVHFNSGIPNFAFCTAAREAGGFAWETVGKVWYAALTKSLQNNSNFGDAKNATIFHAENLFGAGSKVHNAVINGWKAAKV